MLTTFLLMNILGTAPIAYIGFLIGWRGRRDLIAGYREHKYTEPEKFGLWVGYGTCFSAFSIFCLSLGVLAFFDQPQKMDNTGWLISLPAIVFAFIGHFRYRK